MKTTILMTVLALAVSGQAVAGQSGELVCVQSHVENNGDGGSVTVCDVDELRVHVTTDGDVGRPGAFAVGAQMANGQVGLWTAAGGFGAPKGGGLEEPADGYYSALPGAKDYVVYRGAPAGICGLSRGQDFNLWAGHGALSAAKEAEIQSYTDKIMSSASDNVKARWPDQADKMRAMYIQTDGRGDRTHSAKGGIVYSYSCAVASNSNN